MRSRLLLTFVVTCASAASAQEVPGATPSLPATGLPALPDSLRLYGVTQSVRPTLPSFAPPPDAVRLTLDEAVRVAIARNPQQAIAALEALRAEAVATPGAAGFLPTVTLGTRLSGSENATFGGGGTQDSTQTGGSGGTGGGGTLLSADVQVGYTLYDGGRRAATLRLLEAEARRLALVADADAEALALATAAAYLDVARQAGLADAFAEAVAVSEARLALAQAEVQIGTAAEIDAAVALADLNADRAALVRQEIATAGARATLGGLLALDDPLAVALAEAPLDPGPEADLDRLLFTSLAENRRVQAARAAEVVADEAIAEARAFYRPTLRATAGGGLRAAETGAFPPGLSPTLGPSLSYGLTASLPLFDGGERARRLQTARIRAEQAALSTGDAVSTVRSTAARLAATVRGSRALVDLETQNENIARQNVTVATAQFRLGFITALDLRLVQLALVDTRTRRVEALYQARRAETELRLLAGDLLPPEAAIVGTDRGRE